MNTLHADDTPINLAAQEIFELLQKHMGASCEPEAFNEFSKRFYAVLNDGSRNSVNGLMVGMATAIYCAIKAHSYNYWDALAQVNHDITLSEPVETKKTGFTREQEDWLCYQIGDWYLDWKHCIAKGEHQLGRAKEDLKLRLCTEDKDNE